MIARVRHHEAEHPNLLGQGLRRLGHLSLDVEEGVPGLQGDVPVREDMLRHVILLRDNHRENC